MPATKETTRKFIVDTHEYIVDGRRWPSVTEVLRAANLIDFRMIPQEVLRVAAARGTLVHKALALYCHDELDMASVAPEIEGYVQAGINFLRDSRFVPGYIERRLWCDERRYAGTCDMTGVFDWSSPRSRLSSLRAFPPLKRPNVAVVDWKTGIVLDGYRYQLAGYANCLPSPLRFRRLAVKLSDDGLYRVHEFPAEDFARDRDVFFAALTGRWKEMEG